MKLLVLLSSVVVGLNVFAGELPVSTGAETIYLSEAKKIDYKALLRVEMPSEDERAEKPNFVALDETKVDDSKPLSGENVLLPTAVLINKGNVTEIGERLFSKMPESFQQIVAAGAIYDLRIRDFDALKHHYVRYVQQVNSQDFSDQGHGFHSPLFVSLKWTLAKVEEGKYLSDEASVIEETHHHVMVLKSYEMNGELESLETEAIRSEFSAWYQKFANENVYSQFDPSDIGSLGTFQFKMEDSKSLVQFFLESVFTNSEMRTELEKLVRDLQSI